MDGLRRVIPIKSNPCSGKPMCLPCAECVIVCPLRHAAVVKRETKQFTARHLSRECSKAVDERKCGERQFFTIPRRTQASPEVDEGVRLHFENGRGPTEWGRGLVIGDAVIQMTYSARIPPPTAPPFSKRGV